MSKSRVTYALRSDVGPEQARDLRARAWAFVFSCWLAKREDGSASTPDDPKVRETREGNYVEHLCGETSSIAHYRFTKEKE